MVDSGALLISTGEFRLQVGAEGAIPPRNLSGTRDRQKQATLEYPVVRDLVSTEGEAVLFVRPPPRSTCVPPPS
jgi:hypothetical protein